MNQKYDQNQHSIRYYRILFPLLVICSVACSNSGVTSANHPVREANNRVMGTSTIVVDESTNVPLNNETPKPLLSEPATVAQIPTSSITTIIPTSNPAMTRVVATPTAIISPSATNSIYQSYTIFSLASRKYGGGELEIVDTLETRNSFTRYLITYPSDGLTIQGFMNVPNIGTKFPVAIVLHGYVPPEEYSTLSYTTRYADALAEAGFFVIHPNMRGFPVADEVEDRFRTGLAIDILNLIAIIREQSQDPLGYLRRADAEKIHLMGHSMGGGVALRVVTVNNEPYIHAVVLYGSMSGDEKLNYEQIKVWSDGHVGDFELAVPEDVLKEISPINQLDRITAAVSIHHSTSDPIVPVGWSESLCHRLEQVNHPVECYFYDGLPHTFSGAGDALFIERVIDFFNRY